MTSTTDETGIRIDAAAQVVLEHIEPSIDFAAPMTRGVLVAIVGYAVSYGFAAGIDAARKTLAECGVAP